MPNHSSTKNDTQRKHYAYFKSISTRWIDNDVYGHVNNAVYYTYFDTVCNSFLIEKGGLDIATSPIVGFIVASNCQYLSPIKFPSTINAGMRVNRIGNRSIEYGVGIFCDDNVTASAHGTFTHVFVERATGQSTGIPQAIRTAFSEIYVEPT
ncbi:MAG: acyl-CoA thioester hydrolase [Granulosicoccus sp.]|jgi:acyl-CoA thioester hydrolase